MPVWEEGEEEGGAYGRSDPPGASGTRWHFCCWSSEGSVPGYRQQPLGLASWGAIGAVVVGGAIWRAALTRRCGEEPGDGNSWASVFWSVKRGLMLPP